MLGDQLLGWCQGRSHQEQAGCGSKAASVPPHLLTDCAASVALALKGREDSVV